MALMHHCDRCDQPARPAAPHAAGESVKLPERWRNTTIRARGGGQQEQRYVTLCDRCDADLVAWFDRTGRHEVAQDRAGTRDVVQVTP